MKTVLETLQGGAGYFEKHGVESARLQMEHLLAHVLNCERLQLYLDFDRPLEEAELAPLRDLVKRRASGEPLQHLLGAVEFHGREFKCDGRALVPRPETEEFAEKILGRAPSGEVRILDMGAGSGVIGLTLGCEIEGSRVTLVDLDPIALALARENAAGVGLEAERISFLESDLFEGVQGEFEVVAANLPYVSRDEMGGLSREVRHDPEMALHGGETGREILERFIADSPQFLATGGLLAMEAGAGQAAALCEALRAAGLGDVEVLADYSGIERFLFARKA